MDWRHFSTALDGSVTQIKLERTPDGKKQVLSKQIIPPEVCNQIFAINEFKQSGPSIKESIRGNTQRHKVEVANMPMSLFYQLLQKLGPPWDEGSRKNWRNWLNDPSNRAWRTTLGNI